MYNVFIKPVRFLKSLGLVLFLECFESRVWLTALGEVGSRVSVHTDAVSLLGFQCLQHTVLSFSRR